MPQSPHLEPEFCQPPRVTGNPIVAVVPAQLQTERRKSDVNDAQWIQQLHSYGLLRGSFWPREHIAELRAYMRHRERLVEYAAAHIQHTQKALMQMNVQLHHVVSDITGQTGLRIIRAIVQGDRDPTELARLRDRRCRASQQTLEAALTGNYRAEHVFALRQALELYDGYQAKISDCDAEIGKVLARLAEDQLEEDPSFQTGLFAQHRRNGH